MSTFGGKIQEISEISVDRFDKENVDSTAYFLSHCHTDHMVGLSNFHFQEQMVEKFKYLYASQISCAILSKLYPYIKKNLKELCLYSSTSIHLKKSAISVTPIPAGHCPGSVMFLFEAETCVLYTGDYRINKNDVPKFKPFYDKFGNKKTIHKVYLDTTFFSRKYPYFPKREESLRELCKIIEEWTHSGKQYIIKLNTSAKYGYEYLFKEIWKQTKMPIHVGQDVYDFCTLIPEMDQSVTLDGSTTQIHCKCNYPDICDFKLDSLVKPIKISAFRWTEGELKEGLSNCDSASHYVCYSTHASYEEGVHLIRFLRPKEIEACVKHDDSTFNRDMLQLIRDLLEEINEEKRDVELPKPKLFNVTAVANKKPKRTCDKSIDYLNILDSPPRQMDDDVTDGFDVLQVFNSPGLEGNQQEQKSIVSDHEDDPIVTPIQNVNVIAHSVVEEYSMRAPTKETIENSVLLDILESENEEKQNISSDSGDLENEFENSILMNIIDSQFTNVEMTEIIEQGSEEDNVILSIIDSPPIEEK